MYFKMNYLFENENKEWKNIINGNHDDNNNFWIKYKKTYGNVTDFVYIMVHCIIRTQIILNWKTKIGSLDEFKIFYILYVGKLDTNYNDYYVWFKFYYSITGILIPFIFRLIY